MIWHLIAALPESDCQRNDIDESIDLEYAEEKYSKMFKSLGEKVPKEANIWSLVRHRKSAKKAYI